VEEDPVTTDVRISELLARYDRPDADAADLLCDRHPAGAVAFTVVEADLSAHDLTYGHLRRESARFAAPWPAWASGRGTRSPC
jgi:acetyl-CoA synthetase